MGSGPASGFPIVDVKFTLTDGAYHDMDSSALAFEIAGRRGFREAIEKAAPTILEPIMRVEVVTPEDCVGNVIGDLTSRRGQIRSNAARGTVQVVDAMVPVANMFGYVNSLPSLTRGVGTYSTQFSHWAPTPDPFDPDDRFPPAAAMRA
jgi:elongation factor G